MNNQRILVAYYSRTGTTMKVAEYISKVLGAEVEEIRDKKNRSGPIGWLFAGKDAGEKSLTEIEALIHDPSSYDVVVIGSPVWNDTVSTPIRTYIMKNRDRFNQTALFTTQDTEETKAISDMMSLLTVTSIASIQLKKKQDVDSGAYTERLREYLEKISTSMEVS